MLNIWVKFKHWSFECFHLFINRSGHANVEQYSSKIKQIYNFITSGGSQHVVQINRHSNRHTNKPRNWASGIVFWRETGFIVIGSLLRMCGLNHCRSLLRLNKRQLYSYIIVAQSSMGNYRGDCNAAIELLGSLNVTVWPNV